MEAAVEEFERSILFYADAYGRQRSANSSSPSLLSDTDTNSRRGSGASSGSGSADTSVMTSTEQYIVAGSPGALADELAAALTITSGGRSNEWELEPEAAEVDRAVRILPGVKVLLESIPEGRYAVATSGTKTYGTLRPLTLPLLGTFP